MFKLILKGILLYITVLFTAFFMMGVDSLEGLEIFTSMGIILILFLSCKLLITEEELDKITFQRFIGKKNYD